MQGQKVFRWAVWQMAPVAQRALDAAGVKSEDLGAFIPHQANMRIIDAMIKALKLPEHVPVARDIAETGNTSAASIPLAMERMLETGEAKSGDTALLIGFGAGLVYAAQVVVLP
jgi:3-oxoacyl-[acyl-carrier-protein] synthase-3